MGREIKFRVWDKELKKMLRVDELDFSQWWVQCKVPNAAPKQNGKAFYGERNSFKNEQTDRHILMQYTGLKDKNGKEIYEGDICKDETTIIEILWSNYYQWGCKIIEGGTLGYGLTFPLWHWDNCKENAYRELEVIGTIYENPELLKM